MAPLIMALEFVIIFCDHSRELAMAS